MHFQVASGGSPCISALAQAYISFKIKLMFVNLCDQFDIDREVCSRSSFCGD